MASSTQAGSTRTWLDRHKIHSLVLAIAVASLIIGLGILPGIDAPSQTMSVHWLILVLAFAVAETFVVNLHFRSEAGTFSLLEVPLIFGLLFTAPFQLWLAMAIGTGFSLAVLRRQPALKVAFNVANLTLHVGIAVLLLDLLLDGRDPMSPLGWLAVFAATLISSLIEVHGIGLAIAFSEGTRNTKRLVNMAAFSTIVALANTLQALIAVLVVTNEPWGVVLLIGSAAMLFSAYRGYVSERDQRERVEFLYDSTRSLRRSQEMPNAVSVLLEEAAAMFRASLVELVIFPPPDADDDATRFLHLNGRTTGETYDEGLAACERIAALTYEPVLVDQNTTNQAILDHIGSLGLTDALVGTLRSERRPVGLLVIGDRLGTVTNFTREDLRLFENLVEQSAFALENDQLEQALSRLRELESELSHKASYDHLTGLANRMLFSSRLADHIAEAERSETSLHLLYIDLDDFKPVNDRFGHSTGDRLLQEVARRINETIAKGDVPARLGGDEFGVLLVGHDDPDHVARAIIDALSEPFALGEEEVRIGASIGVADDVRDGVDGLVNRADLAMYRAKQRGKGSVVWHTDDLETNLSSRQALQTSLRRAISEDEFVAFYQPIVRLSDLQIVAAEALVRWRHPNGELLPPADFLDEAERSGLIISIDRLIQASVLDELPRLLDTAPEDFFVSLNLSGRHLQQPNFEERFLAELPPEHAGDIVLEVTESVFVGDTESASRTLGALQRAGVRIALDDFGTGYSSLAYLRHLPIDYLKIAKTFIDDVGEPTGNLFVQAMTTLSHTLALSVIAEGIEHGDDVAALRAIGCDLGQGFHFAKPMQLDELIELIAAESMPQRRAA